MLGLLRFVPHSFADALVPRMAFTHNGLYVQVNENFSGTGGKRSGGRKRNSTLIDLLDKVGVFHNMLDMAHLGTLIWSTTATKDILAVSLHSMPHVQTRTLLHRYGKHLCIRHSQGQFMHSLQSLSCLDSHGSQCTGRKHARLDTSCWNR